MNRVSAIVPSWNTRELLEACLASLERSEGVELETIAIDNASRDGSAERVAERFPAVHLVRNPDNPGFARACNQGLERAGSELVLLLNADTEVAPDAVARMAAFLRDHPGHAGVAPQLRSPDGSIQRACMALPNLWTPLFFGTPLERWWPRSPELSRYFERAFDHAGERDVVQPPAACLMLRRREILAMGGLDERLPVFFNDVDLCRRLARAGRPIRFLPGARVAHRGGASTAQLEDRVARWHADRLTYYRLHHGRAAGVWVKACTLATFADFGLRQLGRHLAGRPAEPVRPLGRALGAFLLR